MKKYIIEAGIILFFILLGVGVVSDINMSSSQTSEVESLEEKIEANDEINDGNLSNVKVEKEDTSNLISIIVANASNLVVKTLNLGLKLMVKIMSGITN